eukprot:NODE_45_length_27728_cov_0.328387.p21 type:complete len:118 gc:universal NODE_45_length_27728_cov_0.328387:2628-2981(+)
MVLLKKEISISQPMLNCLWNACTFRTPRSNILYEHCQSHIGGEQPNHNNHTFECKWWSCTFKCHRLHGLKSHISIHVPFRPFSCCICKQSFKRKFDVKKHIRMVHYKGLDTKLLESD